MASAACAGAMHPSWQTLLLCGAEAAAALAAAAAQMGPYTQQFWGAGDGSFLPGGCGHKQFALPLNFSRPYLPMP